MLAALVLAVSASDGVAYAQSAPAAAMNLSAPADVVMLDDGTIYVADTGNDRILVFHANGTLRFEFGSSGTGDGQLSAPEGLHVVDGSFTRYSPARYSATADSVSDARAHLVMARGTIYVADTGNDRIQVFYPNGTFGFKFGTSGTGDGQLSAPAAAHILRGGSGWLEGILVADTGNDRIQVFYPNGTFRFKFGSSGTGDWQFDGPKDVIFTRLGLDEIYVVDTGNDRIQAFQYLFNRTELLVYYEQTLGSSGTGDWQFDGPSSLDVGGFNNNRFMVADTGNDRIQVLLLPRHFIFKLGTIGTDVGQFSAPAAAAMARPSGAFAVADTGNDRVQVFWPNRTLRFEIGSPPPPPPPGGGTGGWGALEDVRPTLAGGDFAFEFGLYGPGRGEFMWPDGVAFGPGGIIGVPDWGNNRIQTFHPNGTFAFELGSRGHGPGQFFYPNGLAFGPGGIIGVLDLGNHRVQLFHPNGTFAFELGSRGHGPGQFFYPNGLAFGPGGLLAVADAGNQRIQVFRIR